MVAYVIQKFKTLKNQYVNLVKNKEVYIHYFNKINDIDVEQETQHVLISQVESKLDKKLNKMSYILKVSRQIPISLVNEINEEESRLFNLYQDIIQNIDNPDKNKIIEYINKKHLKSLKNKLKIENNKQNTYIDFIVIKLPKIEIRK